MQIPDYWAEARSTGLVRGKPRVVRRFGWSEHSQAEAELRAQQRAAAALAELQAGREVAPRETKLGYGVQGLPIREQVLARHGDLVVTRNSYGARCLNEPDVLFADIDVTSRLPGPVEIVIRFALVLLGVSAVSVASYCYWHGWQPLGCATLAVGLVLIALLAGLGERWRRLPRRVAASQQQRLDSLRAVVAAMPGARFTVYATPAGFRLLALHRQFAAASAEVARLFEALGVDPAFARMCALQDCFRARVSAKPWRIGVRHVRPRPGVWPVHPDRIALRMAWIDDYEAAAAGFAACRHLEELGTGAAIERCLQVQRIHDELSGARSGKPIA
ncbi:MAG: hypothetical protein MUC36_03455 [Planctomycetes bacterium]|jgi:hypothetical protein|nr:hypothetical protein [Planctomycetota bacterium]